MTTLLPKKTSSEPVLAIHDFNRLQSAMVAFRNATTFEEREEYRKRAEQFACEASAAVARALIARRSVANPSVRNFAPRPQAQRGHRAARRSAAKATSSNSTDADPAPPDPPSHVKARLLAAFSVQASNPDLANRLRQQAFAELAAR